MAHWRRPDAEHPAAADGERLHPGLIAQPVNTITSAAYLLAACRLWPEAGGSVRGRALCLAMAANGVGSMGFHGPGDELSHRIHDVSLWSTIGVMTTDIGVMAVRRPRQLTGLVGPLAVLAAGAVVNAMTRTGGRWCRPDSALQGHGIWHLASAAGLAAAGRRLHPGPGAAGARRRSARQPRRRRNPVAARLSR